MSGTPPPIKRQKSSGFETPPPSIASTETPDTLIIGPNYNKTDNTETPIINPENLTTNNLRGKRLDFDNDNDDYLKGRIELAKEGLLSQKRKYDKEYNDLYNARVKETGEMKFTLPPKLNLLEKGGKKSKKRNNKSNKRKSKKSKKSKKRKSKK